MNRYMTLLVPILGLWITSGVSAQEAPPAAPNTAMTAVDYVNTAASSDEFERQTGTLASERARNEGVREMGEQLVADHTKTTQDLTAAATAAGVPVPTPVLHPGQQRMIQELTNAPAELFDQIFLQMQAAAHTDAVALHGTWAQVGQEPPLREVAAATLPIVQGHLRHVRRLQQTTGRVQAE